MNTKDKPIKKKLCTDQHSSSLNTNNATIEYLLNDDCLEYIFQFIPLDKKLVLDKVNKRWNRIAKIAWNKVTSLCLSLQVNTNFLLPYCRLPVCSASDTYVVESIKMFIIILRKCYFIHKIYISISFQNPRLLSKSESEFEFFQTRFLMIKDEFFQMIKELSMHSTILTHLYIKDSFARPFFTDEHLKLLFDKNKLCSMTVKNLSITGDCLLNLYVGEITELSLEDCKFKSRVYLTGFLANLRNLKKLTLFTKDLDTDIINALITNKVNSISEINISLNYEKSQMLGQKYYLDNLSLLLSQQKNIPKLSLENFLGDEFMKSIPYEYLQDLYLHDTEHGAPETI